jgi:hypothetical protein
MVPLNVSSSKKDNRISITIHKISIEDKLKFNALRFTLEKKEYELFKEMVDLYWRNIDKTVSTQKKTALSRKLLETIYRVSESKKIQE